MLAIPRQECRLSPDGDGAEMFEIGRRDALGLEPLRRRDHHRVDQAEPELFVPAVQLSRSAEVARLAPVDFEGARRDVREESLLGPAADMLAEEVVHFGQDGPRQQPTGSPVYEKGPERQVMAVIRIDQRQDGAGVRNDHFRRPIPSRSDSARSDRSCRPLRPVPMLAGPALPPGFAT